GGRGGGPEGGDVARVHDCKRSSLLRVTQDEDPLNGRQPKTLGIQGEVAVDFRGEVLRFKIEQAGLDMEAALTRGHPKNLRAACLPISVPTEGLLNSVDAVFDRKETPHILRATEDDLACHANCRAAMGCSKSCRSAPGLASTGASPLWKMRAPCGPLRRTEPRCTRSIDPSRKPTTGTSFSSRYCKMRSSCVSPMWVEVGSGSR